MGKSRKMTKLLAFCISIITLLSTLLPFSTLAIPPETPPGNRPNAGETGYMSLHQYVSPTNEEGLFKITLDAQAVVNASGNVATVLVIDRTGSMGEHPIPAGGGGMTLYGEFGGFFPAFGSGAYQKGRHTKEIDPRLLPREIYDNLGNPGWIGWGSDGLAVNAAGIVQLDNRWTPSGLWNKPLGILPAMIPDITNPGYRWEWASDGVNAAYDILLNESTNGAATGTGVAYAAFSVDLAKSAIHGNKMLQRDFAVSDNSQVRSDFAGGTPDTYTQRKPFLEATKFKRGAGTTDILMGLQQAYDMLSEIPDSYEKYVLFLGDGSPQLHSFSYSRNNYALQVTNSGTSANRIYTKETYKEYVQHILGLAAALKAPKGSSLNVPNVWSNRFYGAGANGSAPHLQNTPVINYKGQNAKVFMIDMASEFVGKNYSSSGILTQPEREAKTPQTAAGIATALSNPDDPRVSIVKLKGDALMMLMQAPLKSGFDMQAWLDTTTTTATGNYVAQMNLYTANGADISTLVDDFVYIDGIGTGQRQDTIDVFERFASAMTSAESVRMEAQISDEFDIDRGKPITIACSKPGAAATTLNLNGNKINWDLGNMENNATYRLTFYVRIDYSNVMEGFFYKPIEYAFMDYTITTGSTVPGGTPTSNRYVVYTKSSYISGDGGIKNDSGELPELTTYPTGTGTGVVETSTKNRSDDSNITPISSAMSSGSRATPEISSISSKVNKKNGRTQVSCVAKDGSNFLYQWQLLNSNGEWVNIYGANSSVLVLGKNFTAGKSYTVRCVVKNAIGITAISNPIDVKVTKSSISSEGLSEK